MMRETDHPKLGRIPILGFPLSFSAIDPAIRRSPPMLGEHTDEVLAENGYSAGEIASFRGRGIVA